MNSPIDENNLYKITVVSPNDVGRGFRAGDRIDYLAYMKDVDLNYVRNFDYAVIDGPYGGFLVLLVVDVNPFNPLHDMRLPPVQALLKRGMQAYLMKDIIKETSIKSISTDKSKPIDEDEILMRLTSV